VRSDITNTERSILGVITFTLGAVPVGAVAAMFIASAIGVTTPEWFYTAGLLAFIISAGLQLPVLIIVGGIVKNDVPEAERSPLHPRVRHPFSLFAFWWRYIR